MITDLSQVAVSNFPAGSDSPANLDDVQRAQASFIAMLRDGKGFSGPVTLASAATTDIGGQNSLAVEISGTTGITSLGTSYNGPRFVRFTGALLLTNNATTLILPGAANITTAAGDYAIFMPKSTSDGWVCATYVRASVTPFTIGTGLSITSGVLNATSSPKIINVVEATPYTTYTQTAVAIPYDDTIPQITEGVEILTVTIAPTNAASRLRVDFSGMFAVNAAYYVSVALFRDATADALRADGTAPLDANQTIGLSLSWEGPASSTSSTTFRIRFGPNAGTAAVNGTATVRRFGGVAASTLRVTEIAA